MSIATINTNLQTPYVLGYKTYPVTSSAYTSTCFTEPRYSMCRFPKCDSVKPVSVLQCPISQVAVMQSLQPI